MAARQYRWELRSATLTAAPDSSARLWCIGLPAEIDAAGALPDVPFEPRLYRLWGVGALMNKLDRRMFFLMAALLMALMYVLNHAMSGGWFTGGGSHVQVAVLLAAGLQVLGWPAYARIVPGRLDLLQFRPFGPSRAIQVDLKQSALTVDLRHSMVFVQPPPPATPLEFSIAFVRNNRQLARDLFQAARSSHAPGPLSDEELTG